MIWVLISINYLEKKSEPDKNLVLLDFLSLLGGAVRGLSFYVRTEQSTRKFGKEACAWVITHICAIKMPSKRYRSAQMTRRFVLALFVETTSKERRCNVMALYDV